MAKTAEGGTKKGTKPKRICVCGGEMLWSKVVPGNVFYWSCQKCGKMLTKNGEERK